MAEYVSEGLSEQGRRDMVSRIAAGGSDGYEVAETAKRPTADLAAAAEAAVAADPVDLGPGASAALSELTGGTMGSSSSYVDAQREIFERSRQRGGERGAGRAQLGIGDRAGNSHVSFGVSPESRCVEYRYSSCLIQSAGKVRSR